MFPRSSAHHNPQYTEERPPAEDERPSGIRPISREPHDIPVAPPSRTRSPASHRQLGGEENPHGHVTLVVYGWTNAQPGVLSWVFPSYRAALRGARALRNAEKWAVVAGAESDLELARLRGEVLLEETG
jgi:hypothetical protein